MRKPEDTLFLLLFLFVLLFSKSTKYVSGYIVNSNPDHQRESLDPNGLYELEWLVDRVQKQITFNVTVATKGFIGFGLSDNGKMSGSDMIIGGVHQNGRSYFTDRHAIGHYIPDLDRTQNWKLLFASETEDETILSFSRDFDTCDPEDYPISENKISVMWCYGETDEIRYHHGTRGVRQMYLIHPSYSPKIEYEGDFPGNPVIVDENHVDTKVWQVWNRLELLPQETTYLCTMHKAPRLPTKHHVIGFQVRLLDDTSVRHTHHLHFLKCHPPRGIDPRLIFGPYVGQPGQQCLSPKVPRGPMPTEYCTEFLVAWAIGGRAYFLPPHVGIPLESDEYYIVQQHLDNPTLVAGATLNIIMEVFYTPILRENEGGLMFLRHESPGLAPSILIPPYTLDHPIYGFCSSDCTKKMLPAEGIAIYGAMLHTHHSGRQVRLQHFRGNRELPWIDNDNNFGNDYQQVRILEKEHKILPGDQLSLRCVYETTWLNKTLIGGYSTSQEMCLSIVFYYNRLKDAAYQQCSSEIRSEAGRKFFLEGVENVTFSESRLDYVVDSQPPQRFAGMTVTEVSDGEVEWTLAKRDDLQRFHLTHPHWGRCPIELYAGGERETGLGLGNGIQGTGTDAGGLVSYPKWATPHKPELSCSFRNRIKYNN